MLDIVEIGACRKSPALMNTGRLVFCYWCWQVDYRLKSPVDLRRVGLAALAEAKGRISKVDAPRTLDRTYPITCIMLGCMLYIEPIR